MKAGALMLRSAFLFVIAFALPGVLAQPVQSNGPAASVLSPTSPGIAHGAPASVTSRAPVSRAFLNGSAPRVTFGAPRPHHRRRHNANAVVPVPIFIPAYPLGDSSYSPSDPAPAYASGDSEQTTSDAADTEALRQAYVRGAHDALAAAQQRGDSRYGEHYLDSREKAQTSRKSAEDSTAPQQPDDSPATIFVFKDGHKITTQNYAIQGGTLYDFSNDHLTKVKLAEIDVDATKKANDELGITVRLPSGQ